MIAIWLIGGAAAAVWSACYVLRGRLLAGGLVLLLLLSCFGHPFANFEVGPLPLTLDRIWLAVWASAYIVQRRLGRADPKRAGAVEWLLAALVAVLGLSLVAHGWRNGLSQQGSPAWRLVGGYLMPLVVYWIARQSPLDERGVRWVHGALAGFGVYLAATALAEVSGQWWLVYPKYIADESLGIHYGRARGPLLQAGTFGMFLSICLAAAAIWLPRLGRYGQVGLAMVGVLGLAGIYASYTRSVWLGAGVGLATVLWFSLAVRWRPLVLGCLVTAGLLVVMANWERLVGFDREQSAADTRKSAYMRASFGYVSWLMFIDRPLLGFGFGQYPVANRPYLADRSTALRLESVRGYVHHNTFLSLATEVGVVGLGLFLAVLAGWTWQAWRLARAPGAPDWVRRHAVLVLAAVGIYACQLLSYEVSYSPLENCLFFFLAGICSGLWAMAGHGATSAAAAAPMASPGGWRPANGSAVWQAVR